MNQVFRRFVKSRAIAVERRDAAGRSAPSLETQTPVFAFDTYAFVGLSGGRPFDVRGDLLAQASRVFLRYPGLGCKPDSPEEDVIQVQSIFPFYGMHRRGQGDGASGQTFA